MPTEQAIVEQFRTLIRRVMNPDVYNPTNQEVRDFFELVVPFVNSSEFEDEATLVSTEENGRKIFVPKKIEDYIVYTIPDPATYIYVSPTYDGDTIGKAYRTIKGAVDAAVSGQTIYVFPGDHTVDETITVNPAKAVNFHFDPMAVVTADAGLDDACFKISSVDCKISGYGKFVNESAHPMFHYDSAVESGKSMSLEVDSIIANSGGECIQYDGGDLTVKGYLFKQTSTSNAMLIAAPGSTDRIIVIADIVQANSAVINITAAHATAVIQFKDGYYQKLGTATAADAVVAIAGASNKVYFSAAIIQNQTEDFNANGITGDGNTKVFLNGVIIYCAGIGEGSFSLYDIADLQSTSSAGNAPLSSVVQTAGTFLVDADVKALPGIA